MHPFIGTIAKLAEVPGPEGQSLARCLRDSYDPVWRTYDGILVQRLMAMIEVVVDKTPFEEVRAAFNFLAEADGVDPLKEGEELAGPYADMFLESVLDAIQKSRVP